MAGTPTLEFSPTVGIGRVISTIPVAGTVVKSDTTVEIFESKGVGFDVPNLVGLTHPAQTMPLLTMTSGVTQGVLAHNKNTSINVDVVVSQAMAPCGVCIADGTPLDFEVSTGTTVPPIEGLGEPAGFNDVTAAGLSPMPTPIASTTLPIGRVFDQSPPADGTRVNPDTPVVYNVSTGTTVPPVADKTQAQAVANLGTAGLTANPITPTSSPSVPAGIAIETLPGAGTNVDGGSAVQLFVSTGAAPSGQNNSSAIDPWTLLLLIAMPLFRRRRREFDAAIR
jgi:beta-lactam-binding protein with PASTA domain